MERALVPERAPSPDSAAPSVEALAWENPSSALNLELVDENFRKRKRQLANREASQRYRARQQQHAANLEKKVKFLEARDSEMVREALFTDQKLQKAKAEKQATMMHVEYVKNFHACKKAENEAKEKEVEMFRVTYWMKRKRWRPYLFEVSSSRNSELAPGSEFIQ